MMDLDTGYLEEVTAPSAVTTTQPDPFAIKGDVLSAVDKFTFALSVMFLIIVILMIAARGNNSIYTYFLSDRSLTFFPMACSMIMSNTGTAQFLGVAGFASRTGVTVYAYELNSTIALVFLGWIFFPVFIASGSMTTMDYIKKRFGSRRMEVYLSVISIVLLVTTKLSVELYAIYKLLQTIFLHLGPTAICLPVLVIAVMVPFSGGLRSVVYTNTFQAMYLAVGGTFISYFCINTFQSYIELKEKYFEAWPNTTRAHFGDNSTYKYTTCGIPHATSWHMFRSYKNLELPWPGMLFGITVNNLWYWCCDQLIVQTGLGAKNIIHCKYACLITGYLKILSVLYLVLPGLVARIIHPNLIACADPDVCEGICRIRSGCSNLAFPAIFLDVVPPNYRGCVLAAMLAGCISSLAACLNSGSTIFTINIYRNLRPLATELELILSAKLFLVVLAVISMMWISIVDMAPGLYNYMQSMIGVLAPPVIAVYLCGLLWDRVQEQTAFTCLLGGLVIGCVRFAWSITKEDVPCGDTDDPSIPDIIRNFHFLHFAIFLFVICIAYIVICGVFTEPILMVHLYRLIYWLRHSKLDRVDLSELQDIYKTLLSDDVITIKDIAGGGQTTGAAQPPRCPRIFSMVCCVDPDEANNIVSNDQIRETCKYHATIKESTGHAKALNIHAILLLLISAVMWGYFS